MSNRSSSHQHGMHRVERLRPSKNHAAKARKAKSRKPQADRAAALIAAIEATPEYTIL